MLNWQDRYQPAREPERTVRVMTPADIDAAVTLVESVGWMQTPAEWERLLYWSPDGCFVIEDDDGGLIGSVSTVHYGTALGWIGMMVVSPNHQRQGLGRKLMRAALDHLIAQGTERIMLDATDAGRPLYESLGFRPLYKIERWEGKASTYLGPRARSMRPEDVPAVLDLDPKLFGIPRTAFLMRLLDEFPDLAWVDYERGQLMGYLLGRRTKAGWVLGPWMSTSAASAERLLRAALEKLQGKSITLNIPDQNGRALVLAGNHNLRRTRQVMRMIYGSAQPIQGEPLAEHAITWHAIG